MNLEKKREANELLIGRGETRTALVASEGGLVSEAALGSGTNYHPPALGSGHCGCQR
jgi:hypothetical protein